jgi:hypothetical protein
MAPAVPSSGTSASTFREVAARGATLGTAPMEEIESRDEAFLILSELQRNASEPEGQECSAFVEATLQAMRACLQDAEIQDLGCQVLCTLASNDSNKRLVLKAGVVPLLVESMAGLLENVDVQSRALRILFLLALDGSSRRHIADQGGITVCVAAMDMHLAVLRVQSAGCKLLQVLAFDDENKAPIVVAGGVNSVITSMRSHHDADLATNGCDVLYFLAFELQHHNGSNSSQNPQDVSRLWHSSKSLITELPSAGGPRCY